MRHSNDINVSRPPGESYISFSSGLIKLYLQQMHSDAFLRFLELSTFELTLGQWQKERNFNLQIYLLLT